jgi:alkanesulfonate monooxygenase SsuD/methylene tetrahydromethanopterin reductase-like flavin-dependent oxidoreductase (luciferase family)
MVDHVAAAGTAEQVAARVQAYVDAGARHIVFAVAARDDRLAVARRIMDEVVPRVTAPAG